jgi:short-subunit dehydrogenase
MTGIVLPIFDHKNKGLIVNVGSGLGDYSSGLLATYG